MKTSFFIFTKAYIFHRRIFYLDEELIKLRNITTKEKFGGDTLDIKFYNRGNTLVTAVAGEMDHHYAEYARQKIDSELMKSSTRHIIFDFSKLTFMDSSGIGVIAGRYRNLQRLGGRAAVVCKNRQIIRILEMSGMLKLIPVFEDLNGAVSSVQEPA
jgi:stage II sporulation protein AA (anti-sigma F factor antagonist)